MVSCSYRALEGRRHREVDRPVHDREVRLDALAFADLAQVHWDPSWQQATMPAEVLVETGVASLLP